MASPVLPYATAAIGSASLAAAETAPNIPWTEGTIAGAVICVSVFWIRRADNDQRRERSEMRRALRHQNRQIAALVKGYTDQGQPLPTEFVAILAEAKETP